MSGNQGCQAERCDARFHSARQALGGTTGKVFTQRLKEGHQVLSQDSFGGLVELKETQVKESNRFWLMMQGFHQLGDNARQRGSGMLVTFEASAHFLADSQA